MLRAYDYKDSSLTAYAEKDTLNDGYGRPSRVTVYNGQTDDKNWYQVDTCYNPAGEVGFQSYRYQSTGFAHAIVCSGAGDSYLYDALGRTTSVTHSDGTAVNYSYTGRAVKTSDENGVARITQSDALGHLKVVCEISSNSTMPGSGSPLSCGTDIAGTGFVTNYDYDLPSHKTTVYQGAQTRVFQTDSLGRTVLVQEPESGQTSYSYTYNPTGLVVTRVRPAANPNPNPPTTTTTTQYDALGRVLSISYSDGTPTKNFAYDTSGAWPKFFQANVKGRLSYANLIEVQNPNGPGMLYTYDAMGRVVGTGSCSPAACGTTANDKFIQYTYDQTGNLTSETSDITGEIQYGRSPAGEVTSITTSSPGTKYPANLVSSVQNGPNGPFSYQLGNGLFAVNSYDALGRINGGWICSGTTQTFCTGGGTVYGYTVAWSGTQATQVCDTVLNRCLTESYDEFNRLASQTATAGAADNFIYVYDRYGNRWQQNVTGGSGPAPQLSFDTSTNHINSSGYLYDAAGNMISDGFHSYTHDAEGNVIAVDGGATAKYVYDAFNDRVESQVGNTITDFVYDYAGRLIEDEPEPANTASEGRIYWGGALLAYLGQDAAIYFEHQDWQGTTRMRTDYQGNVAAYFTSLPFGDGLAATVVAGDGGQEPHHFAQLTFDNETGTDHAVFRQYGNTEGQWMFPDPYMGSYDPSNPQTFNRYSYVLNNPFAYTDPSGQDGCSVAIASSATTGIGVAVGATVCAAELIGEAILGKDLLGWLFGGPSFHGSMKPRPNSDPWSEHSGITYGANIAGAFGLPDPGCEFGSCGAGPGSFQAGAVALPAAGGIAICVAAEPCGTIALGIAALTSATAAGAVIHAKAHATEAPGELDCAAEWEEAREVCRQLIANPRSPRNLQGSRRERSIRTSRTAQEDGSLKHAAVIQSIGDIASRLTGEAQGMNTDLENTITKAKKLAHQGSEEDALALAKDLIGRFPGEMEVWLLSSYLHARSRRYQKAVTDVTTAIEINKNEPSLFYDRGRYLLALGDDRSAMEDFSVGLTLCDTQQNDYYRETLYFHRAEVRLRLGRKLEALEDLAHVREDFSCWTYKLRTKAELIAECSAP